MGFKNPSFGSLFHIGPKPLKTPLREAPGVPDSRTSNRPALISSATAITDAHITRANPPPVLTRRHPRSASSWRLRAWLHHHDVQGLGRDGLHYLGKVLGVADPGRVEAVGAIAGEGDQLVDR